MPMIDVYAADGTFSDKHALAKDLAAAVMRWEKVPDIAMFRNNTAGSLTGEIDRVIDEIMAANPDQLAQYRGGKEALFGFFVGQAMKASKGKANPKIVNERLKEKLK